MGPRPTRRHGKRRRGSEVTGAPSMREPGRMLASVPEREEQRGHRQPNQPREETNSITCREQVGRPRPGSRSAPLDPRRSADPASPTCALGCGRRVNRDAPRNAAHARWLAARHDPRTAPITCDQAGRNARSPCHCPGLAAVMDRRLAPATVRDALDAHGPAGCSPTRPSGSSSCPATWANVRPPTPARNWDRPRVTATAPTSATVKQAAASSGTGCR